MTTGIRTAGRGLAVWMAVAAAVTVTGVLLLFSSGRTAPVQAAVTRQVSVDYSNTAGAFNPYVFGTLAAPYYDAAGFPLTQTAGFKLVEVGVNMPLPSNPSDPSQYDFTVLDQQVSAVIGIGAEPLIWFGPGSKPADLNAYATYTQNVARHLTQGWGSGYFWNVKAFRFGNEPDYTAFWTGTQTDFFQTYAAWALALKAVDPAFVLDTPGLMNARGTAGPDSLSTWVTNFLSYAQTNGVPIDYFSVHGYSPVPYSTFYNNFRLVQAELQKYPTLSPLYGAPRLANDEWNTMVGDLWTGSYHAQFDTAWVAAHNINALINMVEQGLQLSIRYGGAFNGSTGGCHDFPLTDCNGAGKPVYYAFKGFNWLSGATRLPTTGTDHMNFAAMAGKSADQVTVVLSNYDVATYLNTYETAGSPAWTEYNQHVSVFGTPAVYDSFNLSLTNLPWTASDTLTYERYVVDNQQQLALVETQTMSGSSALTFTKAMPAPSVQVVRLYRSATAATPTPRPTPTPAPSTYTIETVEAWVTAPNGNRVYTRIVRPVPSLYPGQRFPALIAIPGGTGAGAPLADNPGYRSFAASGFVVTVFNPEGRGSGTPGNLLSQGTEDCNGYVHQDDLKAVIEYVAGLSSVDATNIGVETSSFGIAIGAGALGRYPGLPVAYLVDGEGPHDNRVITFYDAGREVAVCGHWSTVTDPSAANVAYWAEREAVRHIGGFRGRYLRMQAETDHAQGPGYFRHTIEMINAATQAAYGGAGSAAWARVNGGDIGNAINAVYPLGDPSQYPVWQTGRLADHPGLNLTYDQEMAALVAAPTPTPTPTPSPSGDSDGDGILDILDPDDDNDGYPDTDESQIGTGSLDPCGPNGWPLDFVSGGIPDSTNRVTITDLTSFLAPSRRLDTSPGSANFSSRWDLVPGRGLFMNWIAINDLTSLLAGSSGFPPMLGGARAFNGPPCPWAP